MKHLSVWEAQPSSDALLQARLARGWQPTASDLADGQKILGYAACLLDDKPRL